MASADCGQNKMKRILFCTPAPLTKSLGAAKVILELAEEMERLGWNCEVRGRFDLDKAAGQAPIDDDTYRRRLCRFLQEHAADYDVVEYDHGHLPFPRTEFAPQTLFVARSVLLAHHFEKISIPHGRSWKSRLRHLLYGRRDKNEGRRNTRLAHRTILEADLVNVSCEQDRAELVHSEIAAEKIVVIPYGISRNRRPMFDAVSSAVPSRPVVAFVGTFDYRKGAREFPMIVKNIIEAVPEVRFRLLGTAGMFQTEAEVLAHFPAPLRHRIMVVPRFAPGELPSLLDSCSVGVFPSHIEGFGFGVLEMLAASLPVIAYDAPGPPMMLPLQHLVPRGDAKAMSVKTASLLNDKLELRDARLRAYEQSQQFIWRRIAETTNKIYTERQVKQWK